MYDTAGEANRRLAGTVVLRNGRPIYVHGIVGNFEAVCLEMPFLAREVRVPLADLDYRNLRLGYVNYQGEALYLRRQPTRRYKQGLNSENVVIPPMKPGKKASWGTLTKDAGVIDNLSGAYPTLPEAIRMLRSGKHISVAFDRNFAVEKSNLDLIFLMYRGEETGYSERGERFILPEKFTHLRESCVQCGIAS